MKYEKISQTTIEHYTEGRSCIGRTRAKYTKLKVTDVNFNSYQEMKQVMQK